MAAKLLAVLSLSLLSCPAFATATPDEVKLRDGRILVGKVVKKGETLEVSTRDGVVKISTAEITAVRTERELLAALRQLSDGRESTAFAELELARTALQFGLTKEMWKHLDECLAKLAPGNADPVAKRLRALLATLEPELLTPTQRSSDTKKRVRALVRQVKSSTILAKRAAIIEILRHEQNAEAALRTAVIGEPLGEQRLVALEALILRPGNHTALTQKRILWDKDRATRTGTAKLIAEHGDSKATVLGLAQGLLHDSPMVRMRTADAYGELGGTEAAALLALTGPRAGIPAGSVAGGGTRAHMASIDTRSFIQDFDVEIAQAAAVANPRIGAARSGVVLDVNVPAVITQRVQIEGAYRQALKKIVGADPGANPAAWAGWLAGRDAEAAKLMGR